MMKSDSFTITHIPFEATFSQVKQTLPTPLKKKKKTTCWHFLSMTYPISESFITHFSLGQVALWK